MSIIKSGKIILSDELFLDNLIESCHFLENILNNFLVLIRDSNGNFKYVSKRFVDLTQSLDLEGENIFYSKHFDSDIASKIVENDKMVMSTCSSNVYYTFHKISNGSFLQLVVNKRPIINKKTNSILGVYVEFTEIERAQLMNILIHTNETKNYNNKNPNIFTYSQMQIKLTERENLIAFLLVNGFNSRQISSFISKLEKKSIAENTINQIVTKSLYKKFNCYSREVLKINLLNYGIRMPKILFSK